MTSCLWVGWLVWKYFCFHDDIWRGWFRKIFTTHKRKISYKQTKQSDSKGANLEYKTISKTTSTKRERHPSTPQIFADSDADPRDAFVGALHLQTLSHTHCSTLTVFSFLRFMVQKKRLAPASKQEVYFSHWNYFEMLTFLLHKTFTN